MPAIFNDEAIAPALERIGIPPGRRPRLYQRRLLGSHHPRPDGLPLPAGISVMLCLEWALNRGQVALWMAARAGIDTGDPRTFVTWEQVWQAFLRNLSAWSSGPCCSCREPGRPQHDRAGAAARRPARRPDRGADRHDGWRARSYRTFAMLAEGAAHAIDSLTAIRTVIFGKDGPCEHGATVRCPRCELRGLRPSAQRAAVQPPSTAMTIRRPTRSARRLIEAFTDDSRRHAQGPQSHESSRAEWEPSRGTSASAKGLAPRPTAGVAASRCRPTSRRHWAATGGHPGAILSYAKMHHCNLPAGAPLDLRLARRLVQGEEGTGRMAD